MKWLPPTGATQSSSCGRYVIVQATTQHWVAYDLSAGTTAQDLGNRNNDGDARALCEAAERSLLGGARKRA